MPPDPAEPYRPLLANHASLIRELYERSNAAAWSVSIGRLQRALERSVEHQFREAPAPTARVVREFLATLHIEDLALSCACADGNEPAWDHFVRTYRPELYAAARAIAGESACRELADSIYAELYGLEERDGRRRSLFEYFHGRAKLSTWLRAILAQRHVDMMRAERRIQPLGAEEPSGLVDPSPEPDSSKRRYTVLLHRAMTSALRRLTAEERLRLSSYYVQGLKLAQIGRLFGEHEATVSRKLERTRRDLRKAVEDDLRRNKNLTEEEIQQCYDCAAGEWPFDLTSVLGARPSDA